VAKPAYPILREILDAQTSRREYIRYLPLARCVLYPIAYRITWLAIRIGLTTEAVAWLSGVVGLIGFLCLMSGQEYLCPIGIGLLIFFNILDCVDGSIARTMNTQNPYGKFLDSLMGWIDMGFWALIGVVAYHHPQLLCWSNPLGNGVFFWLAIGGLTCYFFNLVGFIEGTFDNVLRKDWDELSVSHKSDISENKEIEKRKVSRLFILNIVRRINHNLRVRETHYFLLVFAYCGNVIDLLLGFFLFYYFLHAVFLIIVYSNRGRCLIKSVYRNHDNFKTP
jgi:hypothetical protein